MSDNLIEDLGEEEYIKELVKRQKEAFKVAEERLLTGKQKSKNYYDKRSCPKIFEPGDLVLLYDPTVKRGRSKKLKRPWIGPFKVLCKLQNKKG